MGGQEEIRRVAGMDPEKLDLFMEKEYFVRGGDSWSIVVIRHGYLVKELYTFNVSLSNRFDIWSGTKSFAGTAWGLLFEESRRCKIQNRKPVDLESYAYEYIPEGYPLTDIRKEKIKIKHLLSMTSGIPGESMGVIGMTAATGEGHFEFALGKCPNRYGKWVDKLAAEPGTKWDYCDAGVSHLALAFKNITDIEISEYMNERILEPIGIENCSWDVEGGSGFLGPHANVHTGIHISARELARFGYLMLNKGKWEGEELVPEWWIDTATKSCQDLNPDYGYTWWVNTKGTCWPYLPRDTFALMGYRSNKCYIIPSLDLVVVRLGSGPVNWNERDLIGGIVECIL